MCPPGRDRIQAAVPRHCAGLPAARSALVAAAITWHSLDPVLPPPQVCKGRDCEHESRETGGVAQHPAIGAASRAHWRAWSRLVAPLRDLILTKHPARAFVPSPPYSL